MDYTVGSIADLVSGSNTPNKRKVITKKFKTIKKAKIEPAPKETKQTPEKVIKKKVKKKLPSKSVQTVDNAVSKKKATKRRFDSTINEEPTAKKSKTPDDDSKQHRTVFVGNLPLTTTTDGLKKYFSTCGKVESVRIRSVPVANPNTSKKIAVIKKEFHPKRKSFNAYICFKSEDDTKKATDLNGALFEGHHIRVNSAHDKLDTDENKAIFIGNLSYTAEDDDLWQLFEQFGPISSVRIVRDNKTGVGKGFGYVNFKSADSVELALQMDNFTLLGKTLRVHYCSQRVSKIVKRFKNKKAEDTEGSKVKSKNAGSNEKTGSFQGSKFSDKKKKKKRNKGLLEKKKLIKKLNPNPK